MLGSLRERQLGNSPGLAWPPLSRARISSSSLCLSSQILDTRVLLLDLLVVSHAPQILSDPGNRGCSLCVELSKFGVAHRVHHALCLPELLREGVLFSEVDLDCRVSRAEFVGLAHFWRGAKRDHVRQAQHVMADGVIRILLNDDFELGNSGSVVPVIVGGHAFVPSGHQRADCNQGAQGACESSPHIHECSSAPRFFRGWTRRGSQNAPVTVNLRETRSPVSWRRLALLRKEEAE